MATPAPSQTTSPATRPAPDFSTPAAALRTYFHARQSLSYDAPLAAVAITQPAKKPYVELLLHFLTLRHTLERRCIAVYGKDAGTSVLGRPRSLDDQLTRDLDRLPAAAVEITRAPDGTETSAKILLKPEANAPEGLQSDRFEFLDTYHLVKVGNDWKLDLLKTTDSLDADKEPQLKFEAGIFPTMAREFQALIKSLDADIKPPAPALKADLQARWEKAYTADPAPAP